MPHSYVAFIDESGDDGLRNYREPGGRGGASTWLALSACVFRAQHTLEAIRWRDEITARFPDRKKRELHFCDLNHNQKIVASQILGSKPIRIASVLAAKRPIPDGMYREKNQLYFYMTRYLIERISWMCRDLRPSVPEGDGSVKITFSRRGGMSYDDFREYLRRLKNAKSGDVRIHWPVIDIEAVDAQDHSRNASLQLVDIATSSMAAGLEPDRYGNCETRYAESLKRVTYHRNHNYLSYGVKIVPSFDLCGLSGEQMRMIDLFKEERQPPGP